MRIAELMSQSRPVTYSDYIYLRVIDAWESFDLLRTYSLSFVFLMDVFRIFGNLPPFALVCIDVDGDWFLRK